MTPTREQIFLDALERLAAYPIHPVYPMGEARSMRDIARAALAAALAPAPDNSWGLPLPKFAPLPSLDPVPEQPRPYLIPKEADFEEPKP